MNVAVRVVVPTLAAAAVIVLTASLGDWQLRRADEKLALHRQREAAERAAPVTVPASPLSPAEADGLDGRRIRVRGELLGARSVYIDNRTHKGIAGFHLVTPLKILRSAGPGAAPESGDVHLLVLRGWVPRDLRERTRLPDVPVPAGVVEIVGLAQRELPQALELAKSAPPAPGQRIWQNLTIDAYGGWSGLALQPLLLRQLEPVRAEGGAFDDGLVRDWPQPGSDVDKHRGYAFQWFALAAATAALWTWFAVLRPLRRRAAASRGK